MSIVNDGSAAPAGMGDFLTVARLLQDADALQAEYAKLAEARAKAQAVVDLVAPANEILHIRATIENDQSAANAAMKAAREKAAANVAEVLSSAREQAAAMLVEAKKAAVDLVAEARVTAANMCMTAEKTQAEASATAEELAEQLEESKALAASAATAMKDAETREKLAADAGARAGVAAQQFIDGRAKLQEVSARIAAFVAEALNDHRTP